MNTFHHRAAAVAALAAAVSVPLSARQAPVSLDDILARAAIYAARYADVMQNVVAEETYVQDATLAVIGFGGRAEGSDSHRVLLSDVLLVRVVPPLEWMPLRDVYNVDGRSVRDHDQWLVALFTQPQANAFEQALRIATESARYNIGPAARTVNAPGLPLLFLQTGLQPRFRFSLAGRKSPDLDAVRFEERTRPTIFGDSTSDLPSKGEIWLDRRTGAVMRTEHKLGGVVAGTFTTTFRADETLGIAVPAQFTEDATAPRGRLIGKATYANFRRFDVKTETTVGAPAAN
jgi:hypothetical protein